MRFSMATTYRPTVSMTPSNNLPDRTHRISVDDGIPGDDIFRFLECEGATSPDGEG